MESIRQIAAAQPAIIDVRAPRTMHMGPDIVHVDLDVLVDPSLPAGTLLETTREIEAEVRRQHPTVHRVSLRFPEWSAA